jgi:hypothetical protein
MAHTLSDREVLRPRPFLAVAAKLRPLASFLYPLANPRYSAPTEDDDEGRFGITYRWRA